MKRLKSWSVETRPPSSAEELGLRRAAGPEAVHSHGFAGSRHGDIEGGQTISPRVIAPERRVDHPERTEDVLVEVVVEGLAAGHFDDPTEHVGGDRVVPLGAGLEEQRDLGPRLTAGLEVHPLRNTPFEAGLSVQVVHAVGIGEAVGEARGVGEQMSDGHRLGLRRRGGVGGRATEVHR